MDKPDVDFIEGLSPAISIDQKSASRNPRSTVGTITEVYDYLRLLYARIGVPHCPNDGTRVERQTPQQIVDRVLQLPDGTRFQVLAPVVRGRKGEYESLLADLASQGYVRARIDGEVRDLAEVIGDATRLARYEQHTIEVVVDRLVRRDGVERRLTDSLETALRLAEGVAEVQILPKGGEDEAEILTFSQHLACPTCGTSFDELAPRNFSFNSPYGACETCDGLGTTYEVDPELVVPNPDLSLNEGAIAPWAGSRTQYFTRLVGAVAQEHGIDMDAPWSKLTKAQQSVVLHGIQVGHGAGEVQEPLRPSTLVPDDLRGHHPVPAAPAHRRRERLGPRAGRGLHPRGPVPSVWRGTPAPCVARRHHRRAQHPRALQPEHR